VNVLNGAKKSALVRLLKNGFEDGVDYSPSKTYTESARSDAVFANAAKPFFDVSKFPELINDAATVFGQIMIHEIMDTRKVQHSSKKEGGGYNCCANEDDDFKRGVVEINKDCYPISVKDDDYCYQNESIRCLNYFQSMRSMEDGCQLGYPPAPTNLHTPYFDAELVYNEISLDHLQNNDGKFKLDDEEAIKKILLDYDGRTKTLPGLYLFIQQYLEFHNLIFDRFKGQRGDLSNDIIASEARKLVTAVFQSHIIEYAEELLCNFIFQILFLFTFNNFITFHSSRP
jgi:Animal haem peroxidase